MLETNEAYVNLSPKGEPQLGRRGLYRAIGAAAGASVDELSLLWVLNLADGEHTLVDIAERSGLRYAQVRDAARTLDEHDLLASRVVTSRTGSNRRAGPAARCATGSCGWVAQFATSANGALMPFSPLQTSGGITARTWLSGPRKASTSVPRVGEPSRSSYSTSLTRPNGQA